MGCFSLLSAQNTSISNSYIIALALKLPLLRSNLSFQTAFYWKVLASDLMRHKIHHCQLKLRENSTQAFRKSSHSIFCGGSQVYEGCLQHDGYTLSLWGAALLHPAHRAQQSNDLCRSQEMILITNGFTAGKENCSVPCSCAPRSPVTLWRSDPILSNLCAGFTSSMKVRAGLGYRSIQGRLEAGMFRSWLKTSRTKS